MTDIDKIRMKFNDWLYLDQTDKDADDLNKPEIELAKAAYQAAYAQGQRDLIAAMRPVGYMSHVTIRTISSGKPATAYPVASSWVKYPIYIFPTDAQKIQDMGFLPEDMQK